MLYELYVDRDAFKAHVKGASMNIIRSEIGEKVVSLTSVKCTPGIEFIA